MGPDDGGVSLTQTGATPHSIPPRRAVAFGCTFLPGPKLPITDMTRVLIVNSDALMRDWLAAMLASHPGYAVVAAVPGNASDISTGISLEPDIVLMSLATGWAGGIQAIANIKSEFPHVKVIASALHPESEYINATLSAGADAYVLESDRRSELIRALDSVTTGRRFLSRGLDDTAEPA